MALGLLVVCAGAVTWQKRQEEAEAFVRKMQAAGLTNFDLLRAAKAARKSQAAGDSNIVDLLARRRAEINPDAGNAALDQLRLRYRQAASVADRLLRCPPSTRVATSSPKSPVRRRWS